MAEKLTVIAGCMFAGKSTELVRLFDLNRHASLKGQAFKASIDQRYGKPDKIVVHPQSDNGFECHIELPATGLPIEKPEELFGFLKPDTKFVAVDEVQFFNENIVPVVKTLLAKNIQVIVAGLPTDFRGEPFGQMPVLLTLADQITRLQAICKFEQEGKICGRPATRTQRLINGQPANFDDPIILVGGEESYTARCPDHHFVPGKPRVLFQSTKSKRE